MAVAVLFPAAALSGQDRMKVLPSDRLHEQAVERLPSSRCPSNLAMPVFPVPIENVHSLAPLGKLVPGDHTFPSPHIGVWALAALPDARVPVLAPGEMTLTSIGIRSATGADGGIHESYTLTFSVCADVEMYFHLMTQLTHPRLMEALANACTPQGEGEQKFCSMMVHQAVRAGEQLGTVQSNSGLDVGLRDYRLSAGRSAFINPARQCGAEGNGHNIYARCFTACVLDYLPAGGEREALFGRLHDSTLELLRTSEPRCGDIYTDVAGTAQGIWYAAEAPNSYNEAPHLYLGPSTFTPAAATFSIGTAAAGLGPTGFLYFPSGAGPVNPAFSAMTDGVTYCFETFYRGELEAARRIEPQQNFTVLLRLSQAGTKLALQKRTATTCGSGPWLIDNAAATHYER